MSHLTKIYDNVLGNLNSYLSNKKELTGLSQNIKLFEKIDTSKLKKSLHTMSADDLPENSEVLLLIAESYMHFAFEKRGTIKIDKLFAFLDKAVFCCNSVLQSNRSLPPHALTTRHLDQITIAEFYLHKIKFLKAEAQLFYIENGECEPSKALLTRIVQDYEAFQQILNRSYKGSIYREGFFITEEKHGRDSYCAGSGIIRYHE